jgi:hypothetical protein
MRQNTFVLIVLKMRNESLCNKLVTIMHKTNVFQATCTNCKYFYITWDVSLPYGCQIMGFKSKIMPYMVTRQVSGTLCLSFESKVIKA